MKALLLQQVYRNSNYIDMLDLFFYRHAAYCGKENIDYVANVCHEIEYGGWQKLRLIREALEKYDLVIWLDADAIVENLDYSLAKVPLDNDRIGAVWFPISEPHWNVGVLYFKKGENVIRFIERWIEAQDNKDLGRWQEQRAFQILAGQEGSPVTTLPNEWNCSVGHNWQNHRIVTAFHGLPDRYETMYEYFCRLENNATGLLEKT